MIEGGVTPLLSSSARVSSAIAGGQLLFSGTIHVRRRVPG